MSYCRFSSMGWRCQLYVYGGADGIVIHVAAAKVLGDIPPEPSLSALSRGEITAEDFAKQYQAALKFVQEAEREDLTLPYAGESFYGLDDEDAANQLEELRSAGYVFPFEIIDELRKESSEGAGSDQ